MANIPKLKIPVLPNDLYIGEVVINERPVPKDFKLFEEYVPTVITVEIKQIVVK